MQRLTLVVLLSLLFVACSEAPEPKRIEVTVETTKVVTVQVVETVIVTQPPLATYTLYPTYTPYPTYTSVVLPTSTAKPTYTAYPTYTPPPSPPTHTPYPTPAPSTPTFTPTPVPVEPTSLPKHVHTSADVVAAFRAAGLEVGNTWQMTHEDYGLAPMLAREGTRFLIPSLGKEAGGRVMSFDTVEDRDKVKGYYDDLAKYSAAFFSWTFAHDLLLVQINGDLPEEKAMEYKKVLESLN